MQKKLSQWATENPTEQRRELYNLLCNEVWLRVAHHRVNSNQGRETAGIDGKTISNFNADVDSNIKRLSEALKTKTFEPMPVRRVYIPKPYSEKKRPLGIPIIDDRIVQEALRMILEPIWEADFSTHSYGFRPNRSTYDAMSYIGKKLATKAVGATYQWVIEGDIASYFDTIPHRRLIKAVKKRVADRDIRDLLWKFLRAGVMYRGTFTETLTGTPQGGIVSPLLANIYLHQLDRYMESKNLNLSNYERRKRRAQGKENLLYVRYADDFVVLCNGTKAQTYAVKEELKQFLDSIGLTLSEDKTEVTHITEGFNFLGYRVIRSTGTRGVMIPKVLVPEKAIKRFQHKVRRMLAPNTTSESTRAKITALNRLTRGWCEYYRSTNSPSAVFSKITHEIYWGFAHWLGRKYILTIPKVMRKYKEGNTFKYKGMTLVMPEEYKAKRFVAKAWYNPYTEPEKNREEKDRIKRESLFSYKNLWLGNEDRPGIMDRREEVLLRDGPICRMCNCTFNPYEVYVDHIIPRARFKNRTMADRLENQQVLCHECHRAKTKTDLKVLSRMR
jgi:group II intron reverse transcriptase/maturase